MRREKRPEEERDAGRLWDHITGEGEPQGHRTGAASLPGKDDELNTTRADRHHHHQEEIHHLQGQGEELTLHILVYFHMLFGKTKYIIKTLFQIIPLAGHVLSHMLLNKNIEDCYESRFNFHRAPQIIRHPPRGPIPTRQTF